MSKRIGTMLIEKGLVTPAQLDAALKAQLIVGGHLGTSLIELGFIGERALGQALAETFDAPYAPPELFDAIPRGVIDLLPRDLAKKHGVIPLKKVEKSLEVAMVRPNDFIAVQEIAFATGLRIVPWACPEVRLFQALERYYEVKRPPRYISLSRRLDEGNAADAADLASGDAAGPRATSRGAGLGAGAAFTGAATALAPAAAASAVAEPLAAQETEGAPSLEAAPRAAGSPGAPPRTDDGFSRLADLLCRVETVSEIADAVSSFITRDGERCILFRVVDEHAVCWGFAGDGFLPERLTTLTLPMRDFTLFHLLTEEPYYCGPTLRDDESAAFFERLGVDPPCEIALLPTYRQGRIDSLLYVDSGASFSLLRTPEEYRRLAQQTALSIYIAGLKKKLREA